MGAGFTLAPQNNAKPMIQLKKEENKSIPQILLENGTDIKMLAEGNSAGLWNHKRTSHIGIVLWIREDYDHH